MRTLILAILLATPALALDDTRLLAAIAEVETGRNPQAIGPAGERGMHQLTPAVRRQFRNARNYLAHIKVRLAAHGIPVTPRTIALAWNGGAGATIRDTVPQRTRDYAERVTNLYTDRNFHP